MTAFRCGELIGCYDGAEVVEVSDKILADLRALNPSLSTLEREHGQAPGT